MAATTAQLRLGRTLSLPLDVVSRRTTILGQTDTGKTSTAVVMVEEAAHAGAQFVVIDPTGAWWGITSNAKGNGPGVDCVVMGGRHGDVPLDEHAGREVARLVADEGYNLVLDLDGLKSWGARQRFVADFMSEVYERAHSQILVVVDEAHRLAPQGRLEDNGFAARCLGALSDVVLLGRRRGLASLLVCQRPAKLNKDVLEMSEILIAHRVRGNNDRAQLKGWLEENDLDVRALLQEIAGLAKGVARVSAPTLGINGTYTIRPKGTFDSSKSIGVGEVELAPQMRAKIDLDALRSRMAEVIERTEAEDPARLRDRIRDLQRKLDASEAEVEVREVETRVEVDRIPDGLAERVRDLARLVPLMQEATRTAEAMSAIVEDFTPGISSAPRAAPVAAPRPVPDTNGDGPAAPARDDPPLDGDLPPVKAGARRMLNVLARYGGLTRRELAVLSKVSPVSGTVSDYLSVLRQHGFVDEEGGKVWGSPSGIDFVIPRGSDMPAKYTPDEVYAMWAGDLKAGARRMMDHLMRAHPDGFTRRELAALAGISPQSGTVSDYLSTLRRRGLVDERQRRVFAGDILYLGTKGS